MVAVAAPMARAARAAHPRSAPPSATYDPSSPTHRPSPRALAAPLGRALGVLTLALGNLCAGGPGLLRLGGSGEVGGLRMESPAAIAAPVPNLSAAKRAKKMFKAKLNKVPLFMVTNEGNSPFLSSLNSGDQAALMFILPNEAEKMLDGILQSPNGASSGAKVLVTTLERGFTLAKLEPARSGLQDPVTGRDLNMVWQFMPHTGEQRQAQLLKAKSGKVPGGVPMMPGYTVDGLAYQRRGKLVRPVFLSSKDAREAVDRAKKEFAEGEGAGGGAPKLEIKVFDFLNYLLTLERRIKTDALGAEEEIRSLEFVAATEAIEASEKLKKEDGGSRMAKVW